MIESLARRWSEWVKESDPNNPFTYEFLYTSSKSMLNLLFCYLIVLAVGYLDGRVFDSFLALQAFVTLRIFTGGFHFKSLDLCTLISAAIIIPIPFLSTELNLTDVHILNVISLLLVAIFAPTNLRSTYWSDRAKPVFKTIAIAIVLINFFLNSEILAISYTLQSIFLVKFKDGGE